MAVRIHSRFGQQILQLPAARQNLRRFHSQHSMPLRRFRRPEQHAQDRPDQRHIHAIRCLPCQLRHRGRRNSHRPVRAQLAIPKMFPVFIIRGSKQRPAHRFHPHPFLRIALHRVAILLQPASRRRRDLRRRRRRAAPVKPHQRGAVESGPWRIGRVGRHRRSHFAVRTVAARHLSRVAKVGVWFAVEHYATSGDHAPEPRRIHDESWNAQFEWTHIIAGRGHHRDPRFVGIVHHVRPQLRRHAAHAHRQHVNAHLDRIRNALGDGTIRKQHHRIRHANGYDTREWRPAHESARNAEWRAIESIARQNAQRPGSVPGIAAGAGVDGAIAIRVPIHKTPLARRVKLRWQHRVTLAVPRVQMGNHHSIRRVHYFRTRGV